MRSTKMMAENAGRMKLIGKELMKMGGGSR